MKVKDEKVYSSKKERVAEKYDLNDRCKVEDFQKEISSILKDLMNSGIFICP